MAVCGFGNFSVKLMQQLCKSWCTQSVSNQLTRIGNMLIEVYWHSKKVKVKQSRYRPGVAQGVPGS